VTVARDNETFLKRWSRLKREEEKNLPEKTGGATEKPQPKEEAEAPPLPPMESLTPQSDFSAFMHPKVQDALRRVALKKLFSDPHFNVEDLNEAYSGDWTGGEPITEAMLKRLNQARTHLFSDEERKKLEDAEAQAAAPGEPEPPAKPETEQEQDEPGRKDT
jgi:hypothetical protein